MGARSFVAAALSAQMPAALIGGMNNSAGITAAIAAPAFR